MHPALIPDKHPMCGKYMEALVACREQNPYRKFVGACNEITFDLSKCLKEEKKVARAPRQNKFHEKWAAKRMEDQQRMAQLEERMQQQPPQQEGASDAA